jgi:hypothetical protein
VARGQPEDPYTVLGVPDGASDDEMRRAYRDRARRLHPDVNGGDADAMRRLNDAWSILGDPARRAAFDARRPRTFRPDDATGADRPPPEPDHARVGAEVTLLRVLVVVMVVLVVLAVAAVFLVGFGRVGVSSSP